MVLKKVFEQIEGNDLLESEGESLLTRLAASPSSRFWRRLCFFYEFLLEKDLRIGFEVKGGYIPALDAKLQYGTERSEKSRKFRIENNLPGTRAFCPLITKTRKVDEFRNANFSKRAADLVEAFPKEVLHRASAFLLLKDSKASFNIEKETPSGDRLERWARIIGAAGNLPVTLETLEELQRQVIGDSRMVKLGLRDEGGFVGDRDVFQDPRPDHISAKPEDLENLISGLDDYEYIALTGKYHPVLAAAAISFGFVYIHPFEDGNGRIHRWLMHNVLAVHDYTPPEIVFPISSAIESDIAAYRQTLEHISKPLLAWIKWQPTVQHNVEVLNDTADYYRYFDATTNAEYLFECIEKTLEIDLPQELEYLDIRDQFHKRATQVIDMPEGKIDLMLSMLRNNEGKLSKRKREQTFAVLTDDEIEQFEAIFAELNATR